MEDCKIIKLFEARDEAAIREAELKYGARCRALAYGILGNREDAEEVTSDTWLCAWRAIPPAKPESPWAFFAKITRNLALNCAEKRSALKRGGRISELCCELEECIPSPLSTEETADAALLAELLNRFAASLERDKRTVFLKRYWYMLSIAEIARDTGFSQSKIKAMLMRTRNELRVCLEKEDFKV